MAGEQCPYCGNKKPTDFHYGAGFATKDEHSPFQLESCHDMLGCDKWFIVIKDVRNGNVIANFKRPEDWENKLLIPAESLLTKESKQIFSGQSKEDKKKMKLSKTQNHKNL